MRRGTVHGSWGLVVAPVVAMALLMGIVTTSASAAAPAECRVRNTVTGAAFSTLQAAVDAASDGARLTVRGTCHGGTVIDKHLVIEGIRTATTGKPTLSGAGKVRVLTVARGVRVAMGSLEILRGNTQDGYSQKGSGIWNHGDLILRDVLVRGNAGGVNGSVVYNDGDVVMRGSSAISRNAGEFANILENKGTLTLNDDSSISNYRASGVKNSGTLTLNDRSSIDRNLFYGVLNWRDLTLNDSATVSRNDGGGVTTYGTLTLTMNDSSAISGNSTDASGGGVYLFDGTLVMNDSSSISGNVARAPGGGVYVLDVLGDATGVICAPEAGANVYGNTPDDCFFESP